MSDTELLILGIGISPHENDGMIRFEYYCQQYKLPFKIMGKGKVWKGGNMNNSPGGGQKINELKENINIISNKLIIVTDTFDLIPIGTSKEIIEKYHYLCPNNEILISSETNCWPDQSLINKYPQSQNKYRFLNSGCIMGYRDTIYQLIKNSNIKDDDDDQLFFTLKYLNGENIVLDNNCHLFQTLSGVSEDISIYRNRVYNKYTNSYPVFIHGNGSSKMLLNYIDNYIEPNNNIVYHVNNTRDNNNKIFFALYIDSSTDMDLFFNYVAKILYENKIVYVYDKNNSLSIKIKVESMGYNYKPDTHNYNFNDFLELDCEYYFLLEQQCIITNQYIIHDLLKKNERFRIVCPMLRSKNLGTYFSNFWGAIDLSGFYRRSDDYIDLVEYKKRGFWNVPHVSGVMLMDKIIIENWDLSKSNKFSLTDTDMALCYNFRSYSLFMYMTNNSNYGYLNN